MVFRLSPRVPLFPLTLSVCVVSACVGDSPAIREGSPSLPNASSGSPGASGGNNSAGDGGSTFGAGGASDGLQEPDAACSVPGCSVAAMVGKVVQVAAGELHTCARTIDGAVYCWGEAVNDNWEAFRTGRPRAWRCRLLQSGSRRVRCTRAPRS